MTEPAFTFDIESCHAYELIFSFWQMIVIQHSEVYSHLRNIFYFSLHHFSAFFNLFSNLNITLPRRPSPPSPAQAPPLWWQPPQRPPWWWRLGTIIANRLRLRKRKILLRKMTCSCRFYSFFWIFSQWQSHNSKCILKATHTCLCLGLPQISPSSPRQNSSFLKVPWYTQQQTTCNKYIKSFQSDHDGKISLGFHSL